MAILKIRDNLGNVTVVPALEGLNAYQIAVNNGFIGSEKDWLESLKSQDIVANTEDYWNNHREIIPDKGNIVIILDHEYDGNKPSPAIRVGDGIHSVLDLPDLGSIKKLSHSLTIGDKIFDGSKNVVVDVYTGELTEEEYEALGENNLRRMLLLNKSTVSDNVIVRTAQCVPQDTLTQDNMQLINDDNQLVMQASDDNVMKLIPIVMQLGVNTEPLQMTILNDLGENINE